MTEFLDGVRDGAKGEVWDLTTVNFDAMELRKLLGERNSWAGRLKKLEDNKASISAEIWKKLRNEYDQKLKARENELIAVRERMRKKLDEMVKLKETIDREFPGLHKRREELQLRYSLGDFNQEFYDYVNGELTFQIDTRQKKVEVLSKNVVFYRESLALEDVPASASAATERGEKEADSEGLGKGGGSGGLHAGPPAPAPSTAETTLQWQAKAFAAPTLRGIESAAIAPAPKVEGEPEQPAMEEAEEEVSEDTAENEIEDEPREPIQYVNIPAEEADGYEEESSYLEGSEPGYAPSEEPAPSYDVPAAEASVEVEEPMAEAPVAQAPSYTDEASAMEAEGVQELEEEIEEDLDVDSAYAAPTQDAYLDSVAPSAMDTQEQIASLDEDLELPSGEAALAPEEEVPEAVGRRKSTGLHPAREIDLGEEHAEVEVETDRRAMSAPDPARGMTSRSAPAAQVQAGIAAMSDISNVFARGADSDPEREEAKKILEEVNLEELERAVEGIEGDSEDEELRGFVRDVSGRRGEAALPPPAVLEVVEGVNLGKVFPLSRTSNVTSVGKAPDNTIAMPEDKALSRYHAKIIFRNGKFVIMDLDSTNGTGVNGEAVTECDLRDEDEIIMGGSRYIFRITSRA